MLRSLGQYMYLTPKHESFPFVMPAGRSHVWLIMLPNVICMLLHLFASLPTGFDYHRGYQHGGIVIDFTGQQPPAYRIYYLLVDVTIMVIQCLMLSVHTEREKLRVTLKTVRSIQPETTQEEPAAEQTIESLDAEERGIHLDETVMSPDETQDIEMQPLRTGPEDEGVGDRQVDRHESSNRSSSSDDETPQSHLSDVMASGNAVLGEYHLINTMRSAAWDLERSAAHSLRTISYGATLAALQARRRSAGLTQPQR